MPDYVKSTDRPKSFSLGGLSQISKRSLDVGVIDTYQRAFNRSDRRALTLKRTRISQVFSKSEFVSREAWTSSPEMFSLKAWKFEFAGLNAAR